MRKAMAKAVLGVAMAKGSLEEGYPQYCGRTSGITPNPNPERIM